MARPMWVAARTRVARENGQTLAEYALILALIALVSILALTAIGGQITTVFSTLVSKLS
jgi:pilus assembly protein Flp/PilA